MSEHHHHEHGEECICGCHDHDHDDNISLCGDGISALFGNSLAIYDKSGKEINNKNIVKKIIIYKNYILQYNIK